MFCPFQIPSLETVRFAGNVIKCRRYNQHPGFTFVQPEEVLLPTEHPVPLDVAIHTVIGIVLEGSLRISNAESRHQLVKANCWFLLSSHSHQKPPEIQALETTSVHWFECDKTIWAKASDNLHENTSYLDCLLCQDRVAPFGFTGPCPPAAQIIIRELASLTHHSPLERLRISAHSLELFSLTLETIFQHLRQPLDAQKLSPSDEQALDEAALYLTGHLDHDHSISRLSRKVFLNECKLKRGFKIRFGTTIFAYLRQRRMEHARHLLESTEMSVMEVALAVGYSNPSHFSRAFQEAFGVAPGKLRRGKTHYACPKDASLQHQRL